MSKKARLYSNGQKAEVAHHVDFFIANFIKGKSHTRCPRRRDTKSEQKGTRHDEKYSGKDRDERRYLVKKPA